MDQNAKMDLRDYCDMIRMNADSIRQELQNIKGPVKRKLEKSIFAIQVWLGGIDANVANILADVDVEEAPEAVKDD